MTTDFRSRKYPQFILFSTVTIDILLKMNSDKSNSVSVKYDNLQNGDCGKKETMYTFDVESTGTEVKVMDLNGNGKRLMRRKTHLEKKLFFLVVVLLFSLVVVIGVLFGQIHRGKLLLRKLLDKHPFFLFSDL